MNSLKFGISGIPLCCGNLLEGIEYLERQGLVNELNFTRRIYIDNKAKKEFAKRKIAVSAHAPYYINLASAKISVREKSKKLIIDAAKIAKECNAEKLVLHLGYYANSFEESKNLIIENILEIKEILNRVGNNIKLSPENAGKIGTLGNIEEILEICRILKLEPTIDFAHFYARNIGKKNSKKDFEDVLQRIEDIDKKLLKGLHIHISGIVFGNRGERHHCSLEESKFNWKACLDVLKEFKVGGEVICESPLLEEDALKMKRYFENI